MFHHHASKTRHFSSLIIIFLTIFLKLYLPEAVASASAGTLFRGLIIPFAKEYLPIKSV
jgi:hypothetical protein